MPGRARADSDVCALSQYQSITLGYHCIGADDRRVGEGARTEEGLVPDSGVVAPGQVATINRPSGIHSHPRVFASCAVEGERLPADGGVGVARCVISERYTADGGVGITDSVVGKRSPPDGGVAFAAHSCVSRKAEERVFIRVRAEGEGIASYLETGARHRTACAQSPVDPLISAE